MSRAESVHNENLSQRSKLLGERLKILGFFFSETGILEKNNVAFLHIRNSLFSVLAYYLIVVSKNNVLTEKLGKSCRYGSEREFFLRTVLGLAEVRAKNDLTAVSDKLLDCRKSGNDSVIVSDNAVLERNVKIYADKNLLVSLESILSSDTVVCENNVIKTIHFHIHTYYTSNYNIYQ